MGGERDEDENRDAEAELGGIEIRPIAPDNAGLLKPLTTARAERVQNGEQLARM